MIREIRTSDLPVLSALACRTYTEAFGHSLTPDELAAELEQNRSEACFRAAMNVDTILVAIMEGRLVGYIQLGDVRMDVYGRKPGAKDQAVHALYVDSVFLGQGIGRPLMDAAFASPRLRQAENVYIDVWAENERAISFYLNYGFEIVGRCDFVVDGKCLGQDFVLI